MSGNMSLTGNQILGLIIITWAVLAGLSILGITLPSPAGWLIAWTQWIGIVVGIIVTARVLWSGAKLIQSRISGTG